MPKLKTKRAAHKRFKKTASGRFKRRKSFLRHILTTKSKKRKRSLRHSALIHPSDQRGIERLLPYA